MRIPRVYQPMALQSGTAIMLDMEASHHIARVLRMQADQPLLIFNGEGGCYRAQIRNMEKKQVEVVLGDFLPEECESPLDIHLGQVISRGDKMELTIQKSTELGVQVITPLFSDRCGVKLSRDRLEKKVVQWQKIAIGACEQCGRNRVPIIHPPKPLEQWIVETTRALKLNLHPRAHHRIGTLPEILHGVRLLIGPEGGLSDEEITLCSHQGFTELLLGPRVLRTETAAMTAITALQCRFGDLA